MKLVWKTFFAFALVLLFFAVSIGILFGQLFRQNTLNAFKESLAVHARQLAEAVADIPARHEANRPEMAGRGMQLGRNQREISDYLDFLAGHASEDIWLIDRDFNLLMSPDGAPNEGAQPDSPVLLPENARQIVETAFTGVSAYTEQFSDTIGQLTLTIGQPVMENGTVSGVLLLHAPVAGLQEANRQANLILLYSLASGLLIAAAVALFFSRRLTRPLIRMKRNAALMASGDYSSRCNPSGNDEMASLGRSLDTLGLRLEEARTRAAVQEASRQDFLAAISHELRTPVTVLRGLLEAWQDGIAGDPDETRAQMLTETTQLERLISDLLELSRLQQHDFTLRFEEQSITQILEDAVRSMKPAAAARKVDLIFVKCDDEQPLSGDYGRLKQMFLTVLDNAVRVSPEGSRVTVTYRDRAVTIQDQGPGIAARDLPHIFERYYQGTETKGSSGLGLAIAKAIADRHNIRIDVLSQPGDTVFRFLLPDQASTPARVK